METKQLSNLLWKSLPPAPTAPTPLQRGSTPLPPLTTLTTLTTNPPSSKHGDAFRRDARGWAVEETHAAQHPALCHRPLAPPASQLHPGPPGQAVGFPTQRAEPPAPVGEPTGPEELGRVEEDVLQGLHLLNLPWAARILCDDDTQAGVQRLQLHPPHAQVHVQSGGRHHAHQVSFGVFDLCVVAMPLPEVCLDFGLCTLSPCTPGQFLVFDLYVVVMPAPQVSLDFGLCTMSPFTPGQFGFWPVHIITMHTRSVWILSCAHCHHAHQVSLDFGLCTLSPCTPGQFEFWPVHIVTMHIRSVWILACAHYHHVHQVSLDFGLCVGRVELVSLDFGLCTLSPCIPGQFGLRFVVWSCRHLMPHACFHASCMAAWHNAYHVSLDFALCTVTVLAFQVSLDFRLCTVVTGQFGLWLVVWSCRHLIPHDVFVQAGLWFDHADT